ncbi:MAG: chloramphenicol phosphotransferase CPT family protein [Erythrobacter sp.]
MARVIILNGPSSAGKSTLARALQDISEADWLHVSMDDFMAMLPDGSERDPRWFVVEGGSDPAGFPLVSITNGPLGEQLLSAMRSFVAEAAVRGLDIVVDEVATAAEIADYRSRLGAHALTVVKIDAGLEVLERREMARGNRMIGLARRQSATLHEGVAYDLEIDTGASTAGECAKAILARIGAGVA